MKNDNFLWCEKYRPSTIKDCILPEKTKKILQGYVDRKEIPNLLMAGGPGIGKTSSAKAICNELNADHLYLNASNVGIDTLRVTITQFATTFSLNDNNVKKVVILDEADQASSAFMLSLKSFMEEFSKNCAFFLTTNNVHKIPEPILSRCQTVDFTCDKKEMVKLMGLALKSTEQILKNESVDYDKKVVAKFIQNLYPDLRKIQNTLQKYSINGKIDESILVSDISKDLDVLVEYVKDKKFNDVRQWIKTNENEIGGLYTKLYNILYNKLTNESIPEIIIIINEYQYKEYFVADKALNMLAALTEIMMTADFK